MVWKQDLAKLRQALKASEAPAPKATPKAPPPKPLPPKSLEDEDTMFLQAMGHRPRKSPPPQAPPTASTPEAPPPAVPEDFLEAMGQMKGLKRAKELPLDSAKTPPAPPSPAEERPSEPRPQPVESAAPEPAALQPAEPEPSGPARIHLAAGMAIEVDGGLDLRGHSRADALERLAERIQDGVFLGWRTFHVHLGSSEDLQEAFLDFLASPTARATLVRYAQAPVPMGGTQAWILYFAPAPGPRPEAP